MSDLATRIEEARGHVAVRWDDARARSVHATLVRRRRRQYVTRVALLVPAALLLGFALRDPPRVVRRSPEAGLVLRDGSTARPLTGDAVVRTTVEEPARVVVELARGAARFEITPDPRRRFRVEAGWIAVEVLGTGFVVERRGNGARVEVLHGRVRVLAGDEQRELAAGESGVFPSPPGVEALLAEADAARAAGRPADAVAPLRRIVRSHARDPRAALAAFTLGRVLADELRDPDGAAAAFDEAWRLDPDGPLAADAKARARGLR